MLTSCCLCPDGVNCLFTVCPCLLLFMPYNDILISEANLIMVMCVLLLQC